MRTTLDIEDDVLQAVKELSRRGGGTAGQVVSKLVRIGLTTSSGKMRTSSRTKHGVPILPSRGELITMEHVAKLMDSEGI
jgi:hypothetical protein